jgi:hypothetical protein
MAPVLQTSVTCGQGTESIYSACSGKKWKNMFKILKFIGMLLEIFSFALLVTEKSH